MGSWKGKIITASAGTGKTRRIVDEYISVLDDSIRNGKGYDVNNILAITFTNKAANEMKDRIRKEIEDRMRNDPENRKVWQSFRSKLNYAWISTIHSFCERILKENFVHLNMDPSFQVLTGFTEQALVDKVIVSYVVENIKELEPLIDSYGLKNTMELFREALESKRYEALTYSPPNLDPERYRDVIKITSNFVRHFKSLYNLYEEVMVGKSRLDFEALLWKTYTLLKGNERIREKYVRKFKFIFVDEFQDTNELQKEIIRLIHDPKFNQVLFVGDPKQSIYRFRGADVSVFNRLIDEFEGEVSYLDTTHRSNPSLVEFFNSFFTKVFRRSNREYTVNYIPVKPDGNKFDLNGPIKKKVKVIVPKDEDDEFSEQRAIAKYILHEVESGRKRFRDITLLLRNMKGSVDWYIRTFDEFGIPYYVVGGKGFYDKPEINGLIAFMEALNNPKNNSAFVSFLISPMFNLSLNEVAELRKLDDSIYFALGKSSDPYIRRIHEIYLKFRNMKEITHISELLERIIAETDYLPKLAVYREPEKMMMNVRKFVEISRDLEREGLSFREFVRFMMSYKVDEESEASVESEEDDVVKVMTVHKAKGLEFDTVIVGSLFKGIREGTKRILCDDDRHLMLIPPNYDRNDDFLNGIVDLEKDKDMEEERRILYVAMTRAKDELILCGIDRGSSNSVWKAIFSDMGFYNKKWEVPDEFSMVVDIVHEDELNVPDGYRYGSKGRTRGKPIDHVPKRTRDLEDVAIKTYISPTAVYDKLSVEELFNLDDLLMERKEKDLGILAHEILKEVGNKRGKTTTRLKSLFKAKPVIVDGVLYTDDDYEEVWKILEGWIDSEAILEIENAQEVYSEISISKSFGDRILYGVVDKLYFDGKRWTILDFKFARKNDENLERYKFQLTFYAYILREILKPEPRRLRVLYLKDGPENGVVEFSVSEEDYMEFEKDLKLRISRYDRLLKEMEVGNALRIRGVLG